MSDLLKLSPRAVWELFDAITRIPRPSKKEDEIIAFLENFAREHNLPYRKDAIGNVVITKPASPGMEDRPTVVLQNHVDMVCEKNADARNAQGGAFDFEHDAIRTVVTSDGWVKADGTTLGADNGLGMAMALALLIDPVAKHGPLEALFTVDEETGLTGAFNLGEGKITGTAAKGSAMITGKYLINLDSEEEGEVCIGCAGGVDTLAYLDYSTEAAPAGHTFFEISVTGLKGGHSGTDIEKGRGNSNKILARVLWMATADGKFTARKRVKGFEGHLASIAGGNLRNAIPREARAVVAIPQARAEEFSRWFDGFAADIRAELQYSDAGVTLGLKKTSPAEVIDRDTVERLVYALAGVPNGVQAMSFSIPGLVETSTNLASVKIEGGKGDGKSGKIAVVTSQRSSVESAKWATAWAVEGVLKLAGARVEHSDGYPGWAPNPESRLLDVAKKEYRKLFDKEVEVKAIHAGLECGLFLEKFPHLEMISLGPTITGAHSPDERLHISSVDAAWRFLSAILENIA